MFLLALSSSSFAESFHWADREGFHSVDELGKVPWEHRKDLPMVKNKTSLPFTDEENRDGAAYVWFILGQAGFDYPYTRAADFPKSAVFKKVEKPRVGDIAGWKGFVAISRGGDGALMTAQGDVSLKNQEKKRGKAIWYAYDGPPPTNKAPAAVKAPRTALKAADKALARLDGAASLPLRVKTDAERDFLQKEWEKAIASLETLREKYPDDPQVLRRLGVCYRMGHNLDMPWAWERAEAYLLRTQELAPEAPEAYISLGILYADTHLDYAERAEAQFRKALIHAGKAQIPQVWWGLAVSLYYHGRMKEAVKAVDRLIALRPDDTSAKKLRETILEAGKGK
jgi:Flp pilus assembly protein TadD